MTNKYLTFFKTVNINLPVFYVEKIHYCENYAFVQNDDKHEIIGFILNCNRCIKPFPQFGICALTSAKHFFPSI